MREAGKILAKVHDELRDAIHPGMSTLDIDKLGEKIIRGYGCIPSFLNYNGYPASICVSVNDEVVHGIPHKDRILAEGARFGLRPKVHIDGIAVRGGMETALRHGALSVDHLEQTGEEGIKALQGTDTMPTMLPGSSFFLGLPYGRARDFISNGLGVALASDFNPGSSPSGDMRFVMAQGCIKMKLTPVQALNACTINGAYAMGVSDICGSIEVGKLANLILTNPIPSLGFIPYCYTTPFIRTHYLGCEFR